MTETPLLSVRDVDENKENNLFTNNNDKQLTFRNKPIKWTTKSEIKTRTIKSKFDNEPENEYYTGTNHFINYEGKEYTREQFYKAYFKDYKQCLYKVKFNNDNVFWLSNSQRAKLQYHILSLHFPLVEVSEQDKRELEQLARTHKAETAQMWYSRMKWGNGHEKLITFGALDVRRTDGTSKPNGVYCYESDITDENAEYKGVCMSWESWSSLIKHNVDLTRYAFDRLKHEKEYQKFRMKNEIRQAIISMFYQPTVDNKFSTYLTLSKTEIDKIKKWIYQYFKDGKVVFPYQGKIPNTDVNFTINFKNDIKIVKQHNNTKHNQEMARDKVEKTFSRLTGNEWITKEILAQGFNDKNIKRFVDYGLIERTQRGHYKRI